MKPEARRRFDELVEQAIASLPPRIRQLLDEVPVVVMDRPDADMLRDSGLDPDDPEAADELCGLHTGTALTQRSVEHSGDLPTVIHLFRRGIVAAAGGWHGPDADRRIYAEIRTTLLHEIGHHFGLDEDDLEQLGYG